MGSSGVMYLKTKDMKNEAGFLVLSLTLLQKVEMLYLNLKNKITESPLYPPA